MIAIVAIMAQAVEIEPNSVYRIKNNTGRYMSISGNNAVTAVDNPADAKQEWYFVPNADNTAYYLRNVSTGAYLTSSLATSQMWTLQFVTTPNPDNMLMEFADYDGAVIIRPKAHTSAYNHAHNDGSNNVVCWTYNGSPNTKWTLFHVEKTEQQIGDILDNFGKIADEIANASTYQSHLDALFSDKACTTLKVAGDLSQNEHYKALSKPLRDMVDKIARNEWSETNTFKGKEAEWSDGYARKYRVQLYEPYSEGAAASSMAGIQAYTNMNNPTGVLGDDGDMIYVMVNDEIPEGATLYINTVPDNSMYNSTTAGTKLHQGLNIITCVNDNSHYFIYYTVNTAAMPSGQTRYLPTQYNLKNFEPIKVHIEGGRINGFFNYVGDTLYTGDTRQDYEYTSERATHPMYDLLGKYVILHFFLEDTPNTTAETTLQKGVKSSLNPDLNPGANNEYDPVKIMQSWDEMCFAERILMGIQSDADIASDFNQGNYTTIVGDNYHVDDYIGDPGFHYDEYFNNRMMGITLQAAGLYMNATSWRTAYAPSTVSVILSQFPAGSIWGPAHEYGHMNQTPMRIAGTTEESNNIFSNVALYYHPNGTTSRCDYPSNQLKNFNENKTYLQHNTWGTTRMFWQLWCYYHATKHNTKFYPRLYELLRRYPLKRVTESVDGKTYLYSKTDLLHFAKMCCIAAGEDLTNFFDAWGFFVPQDGYHIDDYDVYESFLTQDEIDEVKAEIKSFAFPVNNQIILIDDRPGNTKPTQGEFDKTKCGELGGLDAFTNNATPSGKFNYTVDGTTVTVTVDGDDGVGFLIFDSDGNLLGFSNSHTFDVTPEVAQMLLDGTAQCQAVGAAGQVTEVTNTVKDGTDAEKVQMLQGLCNSVWDVLDYSDETGTKVGYFYADYCEKLRSVYDSAIELLANDEPDSDQLTQQIMQLSAEYNSLLENPDAVIQVIEGCSYMLSNRLYTRSMSTDGNIATSMTNDDAVSTFDAQWFFDSLDNGKYAMRNYSNNLYINVPGAYNTSCPLTSNKQSFTLTDIPNRRGYYAFAPNGSTGWSLHMAAGGGIVQWTYGADATQWTITRMSTAEMIELRERLAEQVARAEEVLDDAGSTVPSTPYTMIFNENTCFYSNAPYTASANGDRFTSWGVILDNNINTYFHSDYSGNDSQDGLDHYIRIMAPEDETFRHINLSFTTRNSTGAAAKIQAYRIDASTDGETWKAVKAVSSGLTIGAAVTNSSGEVSVPKGTKYIRFVVTKTGGSAGGHPYFAISELSVDNRTDDYDCTPDGKYKSVTSSSMSSVAAGIDSSREMLADPTVSYEDMKSQLESLTSDTEALKALMSGSTGIATVTDDDDTNTEYYDMQGRRVSNHEHGLYIKHQGKQNTKVSNK